MCRKEEKENKKMNLLVFGMKNENSESKVKRALAKGALAAAKKQADLTEAYVNRQRVELPESMEEDAAMLKRIREMIGCQEN